MIDIKDFNDLSDFIEGHKKGHVFNLTVMDGCKAETGPQNLTLYVDNKHTQKRKVIRISIFPYGEVTGNYCILKGYDKKENCWGHKKHGETMFLDIKDCGSLRFWDIITNKFDYKDSMDQGDYLFDYYTYKPSK